MAIVCYILSVSSVIFGLAIALRRRSMICLIFMAMVALFYVPAGIDIVNCSGVTCDQLVVPFIYALLVNFSIATVLYIFAKPNSVVFRSRLITSPARTQLFRLLTVTLVVSLVFVAVAVYIATRGSILTYAWADRHLGGGNAFFLLSTYLFVSSSSIVYLAWRLGQKWLAAACLLFALLYVTLLRSRGFIICFTMPFVVHYLFVEKKYVRVLVGACGFLVAFFVLQQIRYLGDLSNLQNIGLGDLLLGSLHKVESGSSEFSLHRAYYYFVNNYHRLVYTSNFGSFASYRRILFFFDVFGLGLKPPDFTNQMYLAYYGEISSFTNPSLHPLIYGTVFANGGLVSIPFLAVLVLFLVRWENYLKRNIWLYYVALSPMAYGLIFVARGSIYNGVMFLFVCSFIGYAAVLAGKVRIRSGK